MNQVNPHRLAGEPTIDTFGISVKLAGMLLLRHGGISVSEIEALPFVKDKQEARAIALRLTRAFESGYHVEIDNSPLRPDTRIRIYPADIGISAKPVRN